MKQIKHQTEYNEAMTQAEIDFRSPSGKEMKELCPYIFSSNMADAYWITAWSLYHTGKKPFMLHKSSGYKWIVNIPNSHNLRVKVESPDHREGISVIS